MLTKLWLLSVSSPVIISSIWRTIKVSCFLLPALPCLLNLRSFEAVISRCTQNHMTQHKVTVSVRTVCYWCSWDCFPRVLSCVRILGVPVAGLREFCILMYFFSYFLCSRARASWIYVNNCPTRCSYMQWFISVNCCTCFGRYLHPSSGAHITVSTASGISVTISTTCR
jgi:hypothetical protein